MVCIPCASGQNIGEWLTFTLTETTLLAHARSWVPVIDVIDTVGYGEWMDAHIVDRFLLQQWMLAKNASPVVYLSITVIMACMGTPDLEAAEMQHFRNMLCLELRVASDFKPVVFVVYDDQTKHFFLCGFDYEKRAVLTWGRSWSRAGTDEDAWDALQIWDRVAGLLGHDEISRPLLWQGFNWKQVRPSRCILYGI